MTEAFVFGRLSADLYPDQIQTPLREVTTFRRFVGGFAGNVATGLARLGVRVGIVSRVGDDGHGEFIRAWLRGEGVDVRYLGTDPYWLTPPVFCEVWPPDRFPITFYRRPTAPDWRLELSDFDRAEVASSPLVFVSGTALAQSPSRETTLEVMRTHSGTTVFDLDWRPALWDDAQDYPELARAAARWADVVVGNEEEVEMARLPEVPVLVVKRGERGATIVEEGATADIPGLRVDVVNGLGAGDAFAAAFGYGLLRALPLLECVRRGTVAGALVASRMTCSDAMPRLEELDRALVPA